MLAALPILNILMLWVRSACTDRPVGLTPLMCTQYNDTRSCWSLDPTSQEACLCEGGLPEVCMSVQQPLEFVLGMQSHVTVRLHMWLLLCQDERA